MIYKIESGFIPLFFFAEIAVFFSKSYLKKEQPLMHEYKKHKCTNADFLAIRFI